MSDEDRLRLFEESIRHSYKERENTLLEQNKKLEAELDKEKENVVRHNQYLIDRLTYALESVKMAYEALEIAVKQMKYTDQFDMIGNRINEPTVSIFLDPTLAKLKERHGELK